MRSKFSPWVGLALVSPFLLLGGWVSLLAQTPTPGAGGLQVDLSVDRGCGASYQAGEILTVLYRISRDALVTLTYQTESSSRVLFANQPVQAGVTYRYPGRVSGAGPRLFTLEAVAGELRGRAECGFQAQSGTGGTQGLALVNGSGVLLDVQGRPAAGATIQLTNAAPDGRSFRSVTDATGTFHFRRVPLTSMVKLFVSWDGFHRAVNQEVPRDRLRGDGNSFVLEQARVNVAAKVVLSEGGQELPVPDARVLAVGQAGDTLLGVTDGAGVLNLVGVSLERFGSSERGTVRVELPRSLTLGGRFEPGPQVTTAVDLTRGTVDLGTLRFRRRTNPAPTVHLAGTLTVLDSLDPSKSKPLEGLILRALDPQSGRVVAETVTRAGRWSLTMPKGSYTLEASNASDLGLFPQPRDARRIEFDREDLENGLFRPGPTLVLPEAQRLAFTYPESPGLPVQQVVLRVNEEVADLVSSVQRDGNRFTVALARPLKRGDRVEAAVRIDGLLSLFSVAQTVEGGNP